ncbi:MAG TPA: acetyl-CoA carboxylase biotin carboxyl carrier protein [Candidatus Scybalocola faecigallinarum]|uniref:Biotin carboxyl carrier protein of acetyl-CoA carboxylase n=1 Tax=Candidatus Scybalocola faecigallinarum TaxID=2840941 RepID=A0A9D1JQL0_9FIRM|nr:acetyl-CoA carboxylase biotin carboxyl carrier protein [Candidatus Scybalocola faecigallinarum]
MDIDKIMQLIDKVDASGITTLTVEEGCLKISIEKSQGQAQAVEGNQVITVPVGIPAPQMQSAAPAEAPAAPVQAAADAGEASAEEENDVFITSPIVGVFYSASGPEEEPFVKVGDTVKKGQIVGIVEAMKLMNEIESDVDGVIEEVLVENAQNVEYGQSLFRVK